MNLSVRELAEQARVAQRAVAALDADGRRRLISAMADELSVGRGAILAANGGDAPVPIQVGPTEEVREEDEAPPAPGTGFNRTPTRPTGGLRGVGLVRRLFGG